MSKIVCHITTVHQPFDPRIFYKECLSLAKAGYRVVLIVVERKTRSDLEPSSEEHEGVVIIRVPCIYNSRLQRFWKAGRAAYKKARTIDASIYHFHDPEFLWFGYQLARKGKKVIYDVHEDVPRQILSKRWIPFIFRTPIAFFYECFEHYFASRLTGIIAVTEQIAERFEKINRRVAIVKNYPLLSWMPASSGYDQKKNQVCYIGDITRIRGIVEMVKSIEGCDVQLALGGRFSEPGLRKEVMQLAGWKQVIEYGYVDRLQAAHIISTSKIGLVLLHPTVNYHEALPVKLLEYMAAGIPVIASDLRLQKQIVEETGCGIIVNPFDIEGIRHALRYLLQHPEQAREMGMRGRKAIEEQYHWQVEECKLISVYDKLNL